MTLADLGLYQSGRIKDYEDTSKEKTDYYHYLGIEKDVIITHIGGRGHIRLFAVDNEIFTLDMTQMLSIKLC